MDFTPIRTPLLSLLLQLLLTSVSNYGTVNAAGITSTTIVKDLAGGQVGPQIELSATVLETDEDLTYTCREGTDEEDNRLSRVLPGGQIEEFAASEHVGAYETTGCNYQVDKNFVCTVVTGTVRWKKEYGAKYACSAALDEWYYIHWINPTPTVSPNVDLDINAYGSTQTFRCGVDMTPYDINYDGIITVDWQFVGAQNREILSDLEIGGLISSSIASRGANATLTIRKYNPIQHGGRYRCVISVLRYKTLTSKYFEVKSLPKATLKNNKRSDFTFGVHESVKFTCQAWSYPFPDRIEFKLQSTVLDSNTPGVSNYHVDVVSTDVDKHTATFTVSNMSAVFTNDSVFECRVFRKGDNKEALSQTRIILTAVAPPIETTTSLMLTDIPQYGQPREQKTEPWVIAIAVIIPIVIILIIIILLVWKNKVFKFRGRDEGNIYYQAPTNDMNRGYAPSTTGSIHSRRDPTYGHYAKSQPYTSEYAQSKVHHNPLYGTPPPPPPSSAPKKTYGETGPVYSSPRSAYSLPRQQRNGNLPRQPQAQSQAASLPRKSSAGYAVGRTYDPDRVGYKYEPEKVGRAYDPNNM